jgi:O-antigen/teichoic acid export membrane protein
MWRQSVRTLAIQPVQLIALAASAVLLARVTGPEGKGRFTLVVTVAVVASALTMIGLNTAAAKRLGERKGEARAVIDTLLAATAASALMAVGLEAVVWAASGGRIPGLDRELFEAILVLTPVTMFLAAIQAVLLGRGATTRYSLLGGAQAVVALAGQVALAATGRLTALSGAEAWIAGGLLAVFLGSAWLGLPRHFPRPSATMLRGLLGFGWHGYVATISSVLTYRFDQLAVNAFLGPAALGVYSVAVVSSEALWVPANAVSLVTFAHVIGVRRAEADRLAPVVVRSILLVTAVASVIAALAAPAVLPLLFGPRLAGAVVPFELLLPGVVALAVEKVLSSYLTGIGRPEIASSIASVNAVIAIVVDLLLIPHFGVGGAAAAASIVYVTGTLMTLRIFLRESGSGLGGTLLFRGSDVKGARRLLAGLGSDGPR